MKKVKVFLRQAFELPEGRVNINDVEKDACTVELGINSAVALLDGKEVKSLIMELQSAYDSMTEVMHGGDK